MSSNASGQSARPPTRISDAPLTLSSRNLASRIRDALLTTDGARPTEVAVVALLLAILGLVAYGTYLRHGGFIQDDWSLRTAWMQSFGHGGFWRFVGLFADNRPALGLYLGVVQGLLGFHQHWYVALALGTAVLLSASFYLLLRTLRFAPLHAAVIAGLVLIFPGDDSLRLWPIMGDGSWAIALLVLGAVVTLQSFQRTGRRGQLLRGTGLLLYTASLLTYEVGIFVVATSAVLYRCQVPWRRAARAWAEDLVVAVIAYVVVIHGAKSDQTGSVSSTITHAGDIARHAFTLFGTQVVPLGIGETAVLVLAACVVLSSIFVARSLDAQDPARAQIHRWLTTIGVAAVAAIAAYVIYAPASSANYDPLDPGTANRVNAMATLPLVTIAFALAALLFLLLMRVRWAPARRWLAVGPVIVGVALAVSYFSTTHRHAELWATAYRQSYDTLRAMRQQMPAPVPGSMVISFGQPIWEGVNIPIFATSWDLDGAVQSTYNDFTLDARPAYPGTTIACGAASAGPVDTEYPFTNYTASDRRPYGQVYLYSTTGRWAAPRNQAQCQRIAKTFVPGVWVSPIHPT